MVGGQCDDSFVLFCVAEKSWLKNITEQRRVCVEGDEKDLIRIKTFHLHYLLSFKI